jgi:hypothetical protein
MPRARTYHKTSDEVVAAAVKSYRATGSNLKAAAADQGVSTPTFSRRLGQAVIRGMMPKGELPKAALCVLEHAASTGRHTQFNAVFSSEPLPSAEAPIGELIERRKLEWARKSKAETARRLINVKVKIAGPVGIVHFGDPHVDDPGTDIVALERHLKTVKNTQGMMGGNVGDLQNNWVGRLARLYAEQSTSAKEAWTLTEWMVKEIPWLYLIGGNHDLWSGAGDPLDWISKHAGVQYEGWGARLGLQFPNGKEVRVNARHDFAGHSQWNTAHGPAKAIQMGWRDHILTCGHKHTSGYQILKDPANGLISHAIRVAGYKIHDRYGKELGLPNQNITPAVVTIIDPQYADDDPRLVTVIHDIEEGAEFLTFKRKRAGL